MPAPSIRSSSFRSSSDTGDPSIVLDAPGTIISGDLLLAFMVGYSIASGPATLPSGWTAYNEAFFNIDADIQYLWAYKTATGSEPADYTFTNSDTDSGWWNGAILCLQDADVPEAHGRSNTAASGVNIPHPSINTLGADRLVVLGAFHHAGAGRTFTPPTGYTTHETDYNANILGGLSIASKTQASSGATGALDTTISGAATTSGRVGGVVSIPGLAGAGVSAPFIAATGSVYTATLVHAGQLDAPFIAATSTVYTATLAGDGNATLTAPFIAATGTVYTATASRFTPPFIASTTTVYMAAVRRSGIGAQPQGVSIGFGDGALENAPTWTRIDA